MAKGHAPGWWQRALWRLFRRFGGFAFEQAAWSRAAAQGDAAAMQQLAKAALDAGDSDEATRWAEAALEAEPPAEVAARAHVTLAAVARLRDDFAAAEEHLNAALACDPASPAARTNLAELMLQRGEGERALALLDAVLADTPDFFPAAVNRIAALVEVGAYARARQEGERLRRRHPDSPELLLNLASAYLQLAEGRKAVQLAKRARALKPTMAEAQIFLAVLLGDMVELRGLVDHLEREMALKGATIERLSLLASAHQAAGNLTRARELALELLARSPGHLGARMTLAAVRSNAGHVEESDRFYAALFEEAGHLWGMASTWCFEGNYLPDLTVDALFARHTAWAERYGGDAGAGEEQHAREPILAAQAELTAKRPLRIGLFSGDLCQHPVGALLADVVPRLPRYGVEVVAFSTTLREDDLTRFLREQVAAWHEVHDLDDDALVALAANERLAVAVDLAGHTAFHRLKAFTRRLAPVQVTWLGYFHSTGIAAIDYLLTDPGTSPEALGQRFAETPIYLGESRFAFMPPPYAPPVAPAPSRRGLPFTFGSFNRLNKMNREVVAVWAEILRQAPGSRLWLKAGALRDRGVQTDVADRFAAQGVGRERLVFSPGGPHGEMLAEFAMVDLALDPFPFTGGATTFEGLWMGVPCLTLPGATMVSRQTHAMNRLLGLESLLSAASIRDYIARAVAFASNPEPLWFLRERLRQEVAASPLVDGEAMARRFAAFLRAAVAAAVRGERLPPYSRFD
ncbi:hypothetical protein JCM16106_11380 [Hydrogenophilus islandicus]